MIKHSSPSIGIFKISPANLKKSFKFKSNSIIKWAMTMRLKKQLNNIED